MTGNHWHSRPEIGAFLHALLHGFWQQEALLVLADMPEELAAQGAFPYAAPVSPVSVPLAELLQQHDGAVQTLRALPEGNPFTEMVQLFCINRELDGLERLMSLALARINHLRPGLLREMLWFLAGRLHGLPLASDEETGRFLRLCRELHTFVVCAGNFIPCLVPLCLRARALAWRKGDRHEIILFDLLVGSLNVCNTGRHNNPRFHALMEKGREALEAARDPALFEAAAPYLGICYFLNGEYDRAMNIFMRVSRRLRAQRQPLFEMFYARHWSFAATNRGDADLAVTLLRSRLRQSTVRSDASLALSLRGQLASQYLRMDKPEQALEQLDMALAGVSRQTDIASAVSVARHLAYYHLYCGNVAAAFNVMKPALERALRQGYRRPVYLGGSFLELLAAFDRDGLPPLPGYSFQDELRRCRQGPNRLLRAFALRITGRLQARGGEMTEAQRLYGQAIALFDRLHNAIEADKTRLELAALLLHDNKGKAALLVGEAWRSYGVLGERFWPSALVRLVPEYLRTGEHGLSGRTLLDAYRDVFSPQHLESSFDIFSRMLLAESGRILGMERAYLFHAAQPASPLRLVVGTEGTLPPLPAVLQANMLELAELVAEGGPLILDAPAAADADTTRLIVGLSIDCRPHGIYILLHAGRTSDDVRLVLDERLLRDIGQVLAWSCLGVLEAERSRQQRMVHIAPVREMICISETMRNFLEDIDRAAETDASILLNGESGVGKEMLARRIHEKSGRSGRLVTINMASLQDDLFESEFFGHEKGAFTGAMNSKIGLVELAENGTLFLDELTEASPRVQAKLLRVLQERAFRRVGGTQPLKINFRLVAATNRHLGDAVRQGDFRADLYYRVAVLYFRIPPLRDRRADILPLARYFLRLFAYRHQRDCVEDFSEENRQRLEEWPWPGNVRELRNVIEQSVILSGGRVLSFHEHFLMEQPRSGGEAAECHVPILPDSSASLSLQELEKRHIAAVLEQTRWRIDGRQGALAVLKISRSALYAKLRKYDLRRESGPTHKENA